MDYGKPTTPGEAIRNAASAFHAKAKQHRAEQARQAEIASTLEAAAWDLESDAARWDKHQPKSEPSEHSRKGPGDG